MSFLWLRIGMRWFVGNNNQNTSLVAVLLSLLSVFIRFIALNQTSFANGWDGYYYLMQAHSFITYGHLQSADSSLIYPYFIFFSYLIPNYEMAFKVGAAILGGMFSFACFYVIYTYFKSFNLAVLGTAISIFSPGITYFVSQFPKNLLGLVFLVFALFYLTQKKYLLVLIFVLLATLTHRLTGALGIIFILVSFVKSLPWKYLAFAAITLIIISFLPGILHVSDLERFDGELSIVPQFAPISFLQLGITRGKILWILEVEIVSLSAIIYIFFIVKDAIREKRISFERLGFLILFVILMFPFMVMRHGSMAYRFFLLLPFVTPFIAIATLKNINVRVIRFLTLVFLTASFISYRSYDPRLHDAPNKLYHDIAFRINEKYSPENFPLIIAHKSLAEVIIFKTKFDALNWAVPANFEKTKVLRVVHGIPQRFLDRYDINNSTSRVTWLGSNYCIMPELVWETTLEKAKKRDDRQFLKLVHKGNNPLKPRPYFLLKGKEI